MKYPLQDVGNPLYAGDGGILALFHKTYGNPGERSHHMNGQGGGKVNEAPSALEDKAFCALMLPGGIQRLESGKVTEFCHPMKIAHLGWIDYLVDDMDRDLLPAATALGFSEILVKNLQKSAKSGYEDLGTEMGLMVPAIFMEGFEVRLEPLYILISEKVIVTIHTREVKRFLRLRRYAEPLLRKIPADLPPKDKMTLSSSGSSTRTMPGTSITSQRLRSTGTGSSRSSLIRRPRDRSSPRRSTR